MKILQVNKYLYPKGGSESYLFNLSRLLEEHKHQIAWWGTAEKINKNNQRILYPLVTEYNFDKNDEGIFKNIKKIGHLIWSLEAKRKFAQVIDEFKPDIIHLHNIYHHLTPSIISIAKKQNIPIVMTVHDWSLINHNYLLFDHGKICELTGWKSLKNKCIGNSYLKTAISLFKFCIQNKSQAFQKNIDLFICPTKFVKDKLIKNGFNENKIKVLPYPISITKNDRDILSSPRCTSGGSRLQKPYILFAGRLSAEKGIHLLLKIAKLLPNIQFKIAGTGPLGLSSPRCTSGGSRVCHPPDEHRGDPVSVIPSDLSAEEEEAKGSLNNIKLLGHLPKTQLLEIMQNARLVIIPSLCYETANLVILEAQSLGKTVIASKIGGMQNLITNNKNGILIPLIKEKNNNFDLDKTAKQWVEKIITIWSDKKLLEELGQNAIKNIKTKHSPNKHYKKIIEIYKGLM